jgi:serine/threonine protein kinase
LKRKSNHAETSSNCSPRGEPIGVLAGTERPVTGRRSSGYFDLRQLDATRVHASASVKKLTVLQRASTCLVERRNATTPMKGLEEGQKFERYRVLRFLGNGVSGDSYEAQDLILQRKVCLKLIHPWFRLPDPARRQFFREMQGISAITHHYLTTILDYGDFDGQLYIARHCVNTGSLLSTEGRSWYGPPLPITDAIRYIHQLAQAIQHLHMHGCIHGALTLTNILVQQGPIAQKHTDFAPFLLSDVGSAHFVRRFGMPKIAFLPVTAAPEQAERRVIPESDQYSLATLFYFWLTGRPPFLGSPDEVAHLKYTQTFPPLATFNPGVTIGQEKILRRALHPYPEKRYPDILTFSEALLATLNQHPTTPQQATRQAELLTHTNRESQPTIRQEQGAPQPSQPAKASENIALESLLESLLHNTRAHAISTSMTETEPPGWQTSLNNPLTEQNAESKPAAPPSSVPQATSPQRSISQGEIPSTPPAFGSQSTVNRADTPAKSMLQTGQDILLALQEQLQTRPEKQPQPTTPARPIPAPEPIPQPFPVPEPAPSPEPPGEPEIRPQPAPDIYQPLPEPPGAPAPEIPETPTKENEPPAPQKPASEQSTQSALSARLIIFSPYQEETREVPLQNEIITLGRAGSSDILLDRDNLTSRHHAILKYERDQYVIYDQRSAKGIYVNGQKLTVGVGWRLTDGDDINIGAYKLVFRNKPPS